MKDNKFYEACPDCIGSGFNFNSKILQYNDDFSVSWRYEFCAKCKGSGLSTINHEKPPIRLCINDHAWYHYNESTGQFIGNTSLSYFYNNLFGKGFKVKVVWEI